MLHSVWTSYIPIILFPLLYIGYSIYTRTFKQVSLVEADYVSGTRDVEVEEEAPGHKNLVQKIWAFLF